MLCLGFKMNHMEGLILSLVSPRFQLRIHPSCRDSNNSTSPPRLNVSPGLELTLIYPHRALHGHPSRPQRVPTDLLSCHPSNPLSSKLALARMPCPRCSPGIIFPLLGLSSPVGPRLPRLDMVRRQIIRRCLPRRETTM